MEGNTVQFLEIFEGGKYKNYTTVESEVVTPEEIFKLVKTPKSHQFSFRIHPMKYWHKQMAAEARSSYLSATDWSVALMAIGKTEEDLFPTLKKGDKIDFSKADMNVWYEIVPHMMNSTASEKYFKVVYEMVSEYTTEVIHKKGEDDFLSCLPVIAENPRIMQFLFDSILDMSEVKPEEATAAK